MDQLLGRIETLEQQVQTLTQQTTVFARRLRWWRRLAFGLTVLMVFSVPLSLGTGLEAMQRGRAPDTKNDDGSGKGLPQRIRALERTLQHVTSMIGDNGLPELVITGANLRIVNGLGRTACLEGETFPGCPNGLGNLIVGYNEPPEPGSGDAAVRTGSHNIVVGQELNYSAFGGLVVGFSNTISGGFASVSGGSENIANGGSVSGGFRNIANGGASVSGGSFNTASSDGASVSGGIGNTASAFNSSVSGGTRNTASGFASSVSGGAFSTASGEESSVSGGRENTASGESSSVSGGLNRIAFGDCSWAAGSLFEEDSGCPISD